MGDSYGLQLVTAPTAEPVDLADAKSHLKVEFTEDDGLITGLLTAATQYAEDFTGRKFCTSTWRQTFDEFPGCDGIIRLARSPVQSVSTITYVDTAGTTQTLSSTLYQVDKTCEPTRIIPAYGQIWPCTRCQMATVNITFVAGYGAARDVPEGIKHAIKLLVANWYEMREPVVAGQVSKVPLGVEMLLYQFRTGEYT